MEGSTLPRLGIIGGRGGPDNYRTSGADLRKVGSAAMECRAPLLESILVRRWARDARPIRRRRVTGPFS